MARIWKGGCIIRARFLDRIKKAYDRDATSVAARRRRVCQGARGAQRRVEAGRHERDQRGGATPSMSSSLAYFDSYRRRLPANLVQAQRDFFGSHTYERVDMDGCTTPCGPT